MTKIDISAEQIQAAAITGLKILSDRDLKVPMDVAMSGTLPTLQSMLQGLASGEVVLINNPNTAAPEGSPPDGEQKPNLAGIEGGKEAS